MSIITRGFGYNSNILTRGLGRITAITPSAIERILGTEGITTIEFIRSIIASAELIKALQVAEIDKHISLASREIISDTTVLSEDTANIISIKEDISSITLEDEETESLTKEVSKCKIVMSE